MRKEFLDNLTLLRLKQWASGKEGERKCESTQTTRRDCENGY